MIYKVFCFILDKIAVTENFILFLKFNCSVLQSQIFNRLVLSRYPVLRALKIGFGILKLKKLPIDLSFWSNVILPARPNDDNHCTFSVFIYFHKQKIQEAKFTVLSHYRHFLFQKNTMVDPRIKRQKSKDGAEKPSKKRPYQSAWRC